MILAILGIQAVLRELFVDTAEEHDLTFANLTDDTMNKLKQRLPLGLEAVNPLDAAGPFTPDYAEVFRDSVRYIMEDPNVAVGVFEFEARDEFIYMPEFIEIAKEVKQYSSKPFIVLNTFSLALNAGIAEDLMDHDIPLVNGVENAVKAIANLFANRDQQAKAHATVENISNPARKDKWHTRLATGLPMSETDSLNLLADYGIGIANPQEAHTQEDTLKAVEKMTFPVVLKTAEPHIHHKSDVGGVKLNLNSVTDVSEAYDDLANRLGYRVTIEPMVGQGTELAFGMVNDPQFGPMVMVGSGGIYIEVLKDRVFSLAPFDEVEAMTMIDSLRTRPLLAGVRGAKAADLNQLAQQLANFSHLAADLSDVISEIDVNPIIVNDKGSIAVDALVIAKEVGAKQSAA